jgi:hypothetical protein
MLLAQHVCLKVVIGLLSAPSCTDVAFTLQHYLQVYAGHC